MWELIAQLVVLLLTLTVFFIINLRIFAAHKKGLDPVAGLKCKDISAAEALKRERQMASVLDNG